MDGDLFVVVGGLLANGWTENNYRFGHNTTFELFSFPRWAFTFIFQLVFIKADGQVESRGAAAKTINFFCVISGKIATIASDFH